MLCDLQKASMWKRISAWLFDSILLIMAAVGVAFLLSVMLGYDGYAAERAQLRLDYEAAHGVSFDIGAEAYDALPDAERDRFDAAYTAFAEDPAVNRLDLLIINLALIITAFGVLLPYLLLELLVPLALGHGRTLGKKIFGIGVMRVDGVKISAFQLFVRAILGKYTLETMIPLLLTFALLLNILPVMALSGLALLALLQAVFLLFSPLHSPIHDMIAGTVAVDYASQMIFDSPEALLEYQKKQSAEAAERAEYR